MSDEPVLVELVEELLDAHLDTVEMAPELGHEWADHVRYLQALVRESQKCLAALTSLDTAAGLARDDV